MGKYIKYFKTAAEFAEYYNFADWAPGPDDSDSTLVAYVTENETVYYKNSDMSEFDVIFGVQSSEIDATAETVTFQIKTGLYWLEVYHNGEFVIDYRPGEDTSDAFSVDANMSPLTVTENFVGKWYRDNNGEKGDYITEWSVPITHNPDPNADPVKLEIYIGVTSDGQTPTRLGNGSLTGATRVYYEDETLGTEVDILNDIYIQSKRAWYQFSAQGVYNVCFEFESENQTVGDYFIYSQGTYLDIYTNYPQLGAQTNFGLQGPLMQSSISELNLGEGMQYVNQALMANNLNLITIEDQNRLPVVNGSIFGLPQTGALVCNEDAENFSMWEAAIPSGWEINPGQGGGTVGKVTLVFDIDSTDYHDPIVGNDWLTSEFAGEMELFDPNGNQVSSSDYRLNVDTKGTAMTYLVIDNPQDGAYNLILRRESADLLLQDWLSQGEFRMFTYEEESFDSGIHISLYTGALSDCANLEEVYLGTGFTSVYADSFAYCESLSLISIEEANEPTIYGGATFVTLSEQSGTLVVPSGSTYSNWATALGQDWTIDDSL